MAKHMPQRQQAPHTEPTTEPTMMPICSFDKDDTYATAVPVKDDLEPTAYRENDFVVKRTVLGHPEHSGTAKLSQEELALVSFL